MKNLIYILLLCGLAISCSKDDGPIGTGTATLQFSAGLANGPSSKSMTSKSAQNLVFDSGYVWVSEIVFDGDVVGGGSISRTVERFSQIDFATGISNPPLEDVQIPAGQYSFVNLGVELRDEDSQPSIIMEGTFTRSDASVVPVRFEFNSGEVFEAETSQQVTVSEDQTVLSRIVFDPNVWFSVVSDQALENANLDTGGVIVISENSNAPIFDLVADRLDVSTESVFQ